MPGYGGRLTSSRLMPDRVIPPMHMWIVTSARCSTGSLPDNLLSPPWTKHCPMYGKESPERRRLIIYAKRWNLSLSNSAVIRFGITHQISTPSAIPWNGYVTVLGMSTRHTKIVKTKRQVAMTGSIASIDCDSALTSQARRSNCWRPIRNLRYGVSCYSPAPPAKARPIRWYMKFSARWRRTGLFLVCCAKP